MNHSTSLEAGLNHYKDALNLLEIPNISLNKQQILDILAARDALQKKLEFEENIPIEIWSKLVEQDNRLKQNAYQITEVGSPVVRVIRRTYTS